MLEAKIAPSDFHARHSTVAKTYEYRVFLERPPAGIEPDRRVSANFLARYVYSYPWPLNFDALAGGSPAVSSGPTIF